MKPYISKLILKLMEKVNSVKKKWIRKLIILKRSNLKSEKNKEISIKKVKIRIKMK